MACVALDISSGPGRAIWLMLEVEKVQIEARYSSSRGKENQDWFMQRLIYMCQSTPR